MQNTNIHYSDKLESDPNSFGQNDHIARLENLNKPHAQYVWFKFFSFVFENPRSACITVSEDTVEQNKCMKTFKFSERTL